jgi:hypothetical protein
MINRLFVLLVIQYGTNLHLTRPKPTAQIARQLSRAHHAMSTASVARIPEPSRMPHFWMQRHAAKLQGIPLPRTADSEVVEQALPSQFIEEDDKRDYAQSRTDHVRLVEGPLVPQAPLPLAGR